MCGAKLIRNKESELCEVIKQFEETISKLESNVVTAKREVREQPKKLSREREREAIDSLKATRVSILERINLAEQEVKSLVKEMKQAAELTENLVQKSSSSDVVQNKENLKQKSEELCGAEVPSCVPVLFALFLNSSSLRRSLWVIQVRSMRYSMLFRTAKEPQSLECCMTMQEKTYVSTKKFLAPCAYS